MTGIIPNQVNTLATGSTSTAPLITQFFPRPPTANDIGSWKIGQRWIDTSADPIVEYILQNLVAANGVITANWVQLGSTDFDIRTLTGDTGGAVSPTDGNINILGTPGQIDVTGDPVTSTLTLSLPGGGSAVDSFQPDSGTNPVVPDGTGLVRMAGSGSITTIGGTNTLTTQLTGLTNNTVLLGQGTATIGTAGPGTDGQTLIGNTGADPSFEAIGTKSGLTAYSVICGGITSADAFQNVSGVGTTGQVLTSNGAASLPTWQTSSTGTGVNVQVFVANTTYIPTAGMQYCIVEMVGGGGAGGGAEATGGAEYSEGSGGGGGEYAYGFFSAATIGASQSVTIGAGGIAASGTTGGNGGNTSLGVLMSANGGTGGGTIPASASGGLAGGAGGTGGSGGNFRVPGHQGWNAYMVVVGGIGISGSGGDSHYGSGAPDTVGDSSPGSAGSGYGAGGGGGGNAASQSAVSGGNGTSGIIVITEFL
jgi:hypothetical protein